MKYLQYPLYALLLVQVVLAGQAFAATDYTCHLTGDSSGATDFVGADAVEQAFRAIDADADGNNSTVTITESGVYVGIVTSTKQGLTLQAASGVQPILQPTAVANGDTFWQHGTVTLGMQYDGTGGWGTMAIVGDSPTNRMIIEGYGNDIFAYWVNNQADGNSLTNVEIRNGHASTAMWAACRQLQHGEVFTNCYFNGTYEAGISSVALLNANGESNPGPTFDTCVFEQCHTLFNMAWTDQVGPSASLVNSSFLGQAGEDDFGLTRSGNDIGTDMVLDFDNCTFENLSSYPFWISNGLTVNLMNSTVDGAAGNWICFANVLDGYFNVENCSITDDRIFSRYSTVEGVGANVTIDSSRLIGSGVVEVTGEGCTINTGITYTVTNSMLEGNGGGSPLVWAYRADENFPNPALTLDHCTLYGAAEYLIRSKSQEATPVVTNCILDGSACTGGNADVRTGWATLDASSTNNIFWDDSAATDGEAGWADGIGSVPGVVIIADPLLDGSGHLQEGSPALEAAIGSTMDHDFDGDARPLPSGTDPDIGADESNLSASTAEPPAIAEISNVIATDGMIVTRVASATGSEPITWSIVSPDPVPGDMAIDAEAGVFTWTADIGESPVTVTIQALNAEGTDTEEFTITVNEVPIGMPLAGPWAMMLLAAGLGLAGAATLRRQRSH